MGVGEVGAAAFGVADVPKLLKLWSSYHEAYDVDTLLLPGTPVTARPIDAVEPYMTINGRESPL